MYELMICYNCGKEWNRYQEIHDDPNNTAIAYQGFVCPLCKCAVMTDAVSGGTLDIEFIEWDKLSDEAFIECETEVMSFGRIP